MINPDRPAPRIQNISVPGSQPYFDRDMKNIPLAMPATYEDLKYSRKTLFGEQVEGNSSVGNTGRIQQDAQMHERRNTSIIELEQAQLKNNMLIISLNAQIKALEGQLEQYKIIDNFRYEQIMEQKFKLMEQYQTLNYEQNLIKKEINWTNKGSISRPKVSAKATN